MPEKEHIVIEKKHYVRRTAAIALRVVLYLLLFVIVVFLLILTPPVQRFMTGRVEKYLEKKLQTDVAIGRISFGLSGDLDLQNFIIYDQTHDTLLAGKSISANISYLKLFSNEVDVKDVEMQQVTAKIKRILPDTAFNYQFVVDAFASEKQKSPDTAATAPLKLNVSNVTVDDSYVRYNDVVTGTDAFAKIGYLTTTIDTLDPYQQKYDIPTIILRNTHLSMKQVKPLAEPKSYSQDVAEAATPSPLQLRIGTVDFNKVNIDYDNSVSAIYSAFKVGKMVTSIGKLDLTNNDFFLDRLDLNNTRAEIRFGKSPAAVVAKEQVKQNVKAEAEAGRWNFGVKELVLENDHIIYNDDNVPRQPYGMDYAHLDASRLNLQASDFVLNNDTIQASIADASFREQSGFVLTSLQGNILYGPKQIAVRDLYLKTPGSELKRTFVMEYPSLEAMTNNFATAVMNVDIRDSRLQVKDIITFAPQLRNHPAFANTSAVWRLNLVGNGTMNRLNVKELDFDGLRDTHINASGLLTGLSDPNQAGGQFTIYNLHTNQTDLSLFVGDALKNNDLNLPQTFDASGTIAGNAGRLRTDLNVNTSSGFVAINGNFANFMNPAATTYNGSMRVNALQLGRILRQQDVIGNFTGDLQFNGKGLTPETVSGRFIGNFSNAGIYGYQYDNLHFNTSLNGSRFQGDFNVRDPNADLTVTAMGSFGSNSYFKVNGMVDSIKFHRLNLSTEPLTFHGKIDADIASLNPDYLEGDVFVTDGLLVTKDSRLPLDTVHLLAARTDSGQLIRLNSPIAFAEMSGQYKLAELGDIFQNNIAPYFNTEPGKQKAVSPYNINFRADVIYSPVLAGFVPGLERADTIYASGNLASNSGLDARIRAAHLVYQDNDIRDAVFNINTDASGMHVNGTVAHLKSGNAFEAYNARVQATALHNNIDFAVALDGQNRPDKYKLAGSFSQPSNGVYRFHLNPDSLVLNYDAGWRVSANNEILVKGNDVTANNFVLSKNGQQLSIQSLAGEGNPVQVGFTNFQIGTVTGFMKADTTLVDGVVNGKAVVKNIMTQPVFTSDLTVNDFSFRQDTIGNVNLQVNSAGNTYNTNATISGRGNNIQLTGSFTPRQNDVALDLDLNIREVNMETMEGALQDFLTDASGNITGNVKITGTTANPDIRGKLNFDNTSITTVALGGPFKLDNETLNVTNDGFVFDNFALRDSSGNQLVLNGTARTDNFINYNFNMRVDADHFRILSTAKEKNELYYGDLYITTHIGVEGTEEAPQVDGTITVEDGTNFTFIVPQSEPAVVSRQGIVEFVDFDNPASDSLFLSRYDSLNTTTRFMGYEISANIQIHKEAIFNIVIDEANGDFVNLQGEALLSAGVDPGGRITLTGSYELTEGYYELNYSFVRRQFQIQEGSKIVWLGKPTDANLDVTAIYTANTSPLDLVANYISAPTQAIRNTYLQKLPFQVVLDMSGKLMQPDIAFDIQLPTDRAYAVSGDVTRNVDLRLQQLRQEPGELNKQVFSLLVLNRFVGENPFQSSGGGFNAATYARQSVSKLLTEQLNRLADDLISGVEIDFDVVSTDDYSTGELRNRTDLNVGLTKRLLNDRLTVTVGSNFELDGAQQGNERNNNFAGNVAINYLLSKDGKYRLRLYRKNEYFGAVEGYIIETGLKFIITLDYEKFAEILRRKQMVQNGKRETAKKEDNEAN
ncbi:MAG: translocation/assembly module TamB domain-containing protein [Flavisolibacter sp.]